MSKVDSDYSSRKLVLAKERPTINLIIKKYLLHLGDPTLELPTLLLSISDHSVGRSSYEGNHPQTDPSRQQKVMIEFSSISSSILSQRLLKESSQDVIRLSHSPFFLRPVPLAPRTRKPMRVIQLQVHSQHVSYSPFSPHRHLRSPS